jgi:hypothetical protein
MHTIDYAVRTLAVQAAPTISGARELTRQEFVEWFVAIALIVIGISLVFRSRVWIMAMGGIVAHPLTPIVSGIYALLMGTMVVLAHNLWVPDVRVIVTILGWLAVCSGVLLLIVPEMYAVVLRSMPITPKLVALRGFVRLALGGALFSYLLTQG